MKSGAIVFGSRARSVASSLLARLSCISRADHLEQLLALDGFST